MDVHHGLAGGRSVRTEGRTVTASSPSAAGTAMCRAATVIVAMNTVTGLTTSMAGPTIVSTGATGYHGVELEVYSPPLNYAPAFYGWGLQSLGRAGAICLGFSVAVNPWFRSLWRFLYAHAVYPSASVWLADYMISQSLAAAYQAQADAGAAPAPVAAAAPITRTFRP